ncbi:putative SP-containing protein [Vairimorpha necatrix]|uniref:SP-containing protein n=1 Tax=Vairimorpha necatrix TaxID=6039 RepID=A0AAX4JFQ1_9MICR
MLIFASILSIESSLNNSNHVLKRVLDPGNIHSYINEMNVYDDYDDILRLPDYHNDTKRVEHNIVSLNNTYNNFVSCPKSYPFIQKKLHYSQINWQAIHEATDVVFSGLVSNFSVRTLIRMVAYMSNVNPFIDLRSFFEKFITKFLMKKRTSRKLRPIGHLCEYLAYHSYDLVFDLSFYSSFKDKKEIEGLELVVSKFVDLEMDFNCPWHIIQLYNESMYANPHINSTENNTAKLSVSIQDNVNNSKNDAPIYIETEETQDLFRALIPPTKDYLTDESRSKIKRNVDSLDNVKSETTKNKDVIHNDSAESNHNGNNEHYLKEIFGNNIF